MPLICASLRYSKMVNFSLGSGAVQVVWKSRAASSLNLVVGLITHHRIHTMKRFVSIVSICLIMLAAGAAEPSSDPLPKLDEDSTKGLQFHCSLVKTHFTMGEPVDIWCVVTNTTDSTKRLVWHPSTGSHYCLVRGETNWMGGILPLVLPQLRDEITIKSTGWSPEYLLFLPSHASVTLLLTYKPERPEQFKGRVVYDPITHGGGFIGDDEVEKAKQACAFSNTFEYEVTDRVEK